MPGFRLLRWARWQRFTVASAGAIRIIGRMADGEAKTATEKATTTEKRSLKDLLGGFGILGYIVGSGIWCIVATIRQDLEPSRTLIDLQAFWNDGKFGVGTTVLLSWLILLFGAMTPFVAAYAIAQSFQGGEPEPNWLRVGNVATRGKRRLFSLLACAFGGLSVHVAFYDPSLLSPIGTFAIFVLVFGTACLFLGPLTLLDALVPGRWISGQVRTCERPSNSDGKPQKTVAIQLSDETTYRFDDSGSSPLAVGQRVAIYVSRILDNVIEVRRP